jgi:hypothetical protein
MDFTWLCDKFSLRRSCMDGFIKSLIPILLPASPVATKKTPLRIRAKGVFQPLSFGSPAVMTFRL